MIAKNVDRRLVMRVLGRWKSITPDGRFPRRSQIDPRAFGQDWANCLLIDLDPMLDQSRFAFVGDLVRDPNWPPFERQSLGDCVEGTLLQLATAHLKLLIARRAPISFGGTATHEDSPILYRSILLPLAEDGVAIDGALGAVNYREVVSAEELLPAQIAPAA